MRRLTGVHVRVHVSRLKVSSLSAIARVFLRDDVSDIRRRVPVSSVTSPLPSSGAAVFARFEESTEIDRPSLRRQPSFSLPFLYTIKMLDVFWSMPSGNVTAKKLITLSGGSLGSCVDEERSQLRELM